MTGRSGPDADTNRLLKTCEIVTEVSEQAARRAAHLRFRSKHGSAVDAIVIATAEPGGFVLTGDLVDLEALASHADHVTVDTI
jgi:hypothetical protein